MAPPIPTTLGDLTPAWLGEVLDREVESFDLSLRVAKNGGCKLLRFVQVTLDDQQIEQFDRNMKLLQGLQRERFVGSLERQQPVAILAS